MACGLYKKSDTANTKSMKKPNQSLCMYVHGKDILTQSFGALQSLAMGRRRGWKKMVLPNFTQNMEESFGRSRKAKEQNEKQEKKEWDYPQVSQRLGMSYWV